MIVVVMGVTGCGKSTVGEALAKSLGWTFLDADDFHPAANVEKMRAGIPLTDADRWPWLDRLRDECAAILARGEHAVLACSALRQAYRDRLSAAGEVRFVHLVGSFEAIAARIANRRHRYMPASLLRSQFDTLEPPRDAIDVDVGLPMAAKLQRIRAALALAPQ